MNSFDAIEKVEKLLSELLKLNATFDNKLLDVHAEQIQNKIKLCSKLFTAKHKETKMRQVILREGMHRLILILEDERSANTIPSD